MYFPCFGGGFFCAFLQNEGGRYALNEKVAKNYNIFCERVLTKFFFRDRIKKTEQGGFIQ